MKHAALSLLALVLSAGALRADEGMWTFDNLPLQQMKARYGFAPDAAWLKRVQLATVRLSGGTGAFVSADGLIVTNHHMGRGYVAQLSTVEKDYIKHGFVAADRAGELKVPGMSVSILLSMENVTEAVRAAGAKAKTEADAVKARKTELERLREEEAKKSGHTCESVTLYQGGEYWIYRYKRFSDVRLVMSPDTQIGAWGGDDDNYTYPRYSLDYAFFRAYENGQPYRPEAYMPMPSSPLKAGDLTIISGHPGSTFRQWTLAQMEQARDFALPSQIRSQERQKKDLLTFAATGKEAERLALDVIYGIDNGRKRNEARLLGLKNPAATQKVAEEEKALKAAVAKDPALQARVGQSWAKIAQALLTEKKLYNETTYISTRGSSLLGHALELVRVHAELAKPVDQRLSEFANEKALRQRLTNPRPIPKSLETARLASALTEATEALGAKHPFILAILGGKSPEAVAKTAVEGTKLDSLDVRKALLEGSAKALAESTDSMLALARILEPHQRRARKATETQVTNVIAEHATRIAEARFKVYGKTVYPDATGTLRLGFGPVTTYATGSGTKAQPFTTFYGLYDRYEGWGGNAAAAQGGQWTLHPRWIERKDKLNLATPFNFIYGCDTVGGSSGSPVVNVKGEFIGINHDSIFEGQGGYYVYDPATKRAIAVDARAILETLEKLYDAGHLVKELLAR